MDLFSKKKDLKELYNFKIDNRNRLRQIKKHFRKWKTSQDKEE